jgi:CheY-like chemotaxis protein
VLPGRRILVELRQLPVGEGALLIALTGYGTPEEKERVREAGFVAHLVKLANLDELQRPLTGQPRAVHWSRKASQ